MTTEDADPFDDPRLEEALARAGARGDVGLHIEKRKVSDADARALEVYREEQLVGVLIYVSLGSRQIRVLDADQRDHAEVAEAIARGFAEGDPVGALVDALDALAEAD